MSVASGFSAPMKSVHFASDALTHTRISLTSQLEEKDLIMKAMTRTSLKTALLGAVAIPALFSAALVQASDKPPADALPLSEIISALEGKGYQPVLEASFEDSSLFTDNDVSDNGVWEIEAIKEGYKRELKVDPLEGVILSDELDD